MRLVARAAGALAVTVTVQTTTAAVLTYDFSDNGTSANSNSGHLCCYSLRLDSWRGTDYMLQGKNYTDSMMIFSFDAGSAKLIYHDQTGIARIEGVMRWSLIDGTFGETAEVMYAMLGV